MMRTVMNQQNTNHSLPSSTFYSMQLLPRVIRAKDAPAYLGMCRDVFNQSVKPKVQSFPIGKQGVGFDRLDLDEWLVQYKASNERPAKVDIGETLWVKEEDFQDLGLEVDAGTLINGISISQEADFNKALALAKTISKKRKRT